MTTTDTITALRVLACRPTARGHITVSGSYHVNRDGREVSGLEGLEVEFRKGDEDFDFFLSLELPTARALIDALTEALGDVR